MSAVPDRHIPAALELQEKQSLLHLLLQNIRSGVLFSLAYFAAYGCARFFSQRTGTRLWLPDSVFLCALLLAPRKKWWLYVLMTMPIRFVPGVRAQVPAWFLWLTWTNDMVKGLLAARLLQFANGTPIRLNSVRRYATYLGIAVMLVPLLSAFFGAALRHFALRHAYWPAFGQWLLGDILANLVITPTLLMWLSRDYRPLRPRLLETVTWAIGFAFCLFYTALYAGFDQSILAVYAPFPFLVWAALRLGAIGASTGLSLTTMFVILGLSRHQGPFSYLIAEHMHFLQMFLAILSLPIMFVAILFEERQAVEERLRENQTELKKNVERNRDLAGRLIRAQEEERKKIARELHDDLSQRMALLFAGLDRLAGMLPEKTGEAQSQLAALKSSTEGVSDDLRDLSHQLHSATLQHLGIVKGLESFCRAFSQQHHVDVSLLTEPVHDVPDPVSLCLFRVAQEALNNAVKHGHARQIEVKLGQTARLLRLEIKDTGVGFNPAEAMDGLGLVSMRERLRMVGGTLNLKSARGEGTVIEAVVESAA
ncbi:MAG TPA: MASE1 domain-containing protein [Candidatus Angelobacter sp.]|nr:MASE1 domain-containing protein [Candidatus Angelobacter sp.]